MMHSNVVVGILCVAACATLCGGAPLNDENNKIATESQFINFQTVLKKYNKFVRSPEPFRNVVSTRDLLEENVQKVQPIGVVLRRCPKTIPTMENWECRSDNSVTVILKVRIHDGHSFKFHRIETKEDISCICDHQH